jgi:hypothetical protein
VEIVNEPACANGTFRFVREPRITSFHWLNKTNRRGLVLCLITGGLSVTCNRETKWQKVEHQIKRAPNISMLNLLLGEVHRLNNNWITCYGCGRKQTACSNLGTLY